jgi:hypothetical protein
MKQYRKSVFFLLVFFSFLVAHAQTSVYHSFPDSNAQWNFQLSVMSCNENYSIVLSGDTTIKAKLYHKLAITGVQPIFPYPCNTKGYKGAIREDIPAKKVFIIPASDTTEHLLYDFNMNVGDTLKGYIRGFGFPNDYVVQSIDSVFVGTTYRKRWNFANCLGGYYRVSIIEGIGSLHGLYETFYGCVIDMPEYELLCFKQDGQTLYPNMTTACNLITSINTTNLLSENEIKVYPNPSNGYVNVQCNGISVREIKLTDMFGREVYHQQNFVQNEIQIHQLSSGAYILTVVDDKNRMTNTKIINYP